MWSTRKLSPFLKPYWHYAVLAPLFMALEVAMDLLQPRLTQRIVDQGIARGDLSLVLHTGLWMLGAAVVGMAAGVGCGVFTVLAGQNFGADLRGGLFRKIETLSFGNLDTLETGGLITRLTNDVSQVQELVMIMLRIMIRAPLLLVGSVILAVLTSPQLALVFLVLIPILVVALVVIVRKTFPMFGEVQRRLDGLNGVLQENLAGVRVVKAFARASHERGRFGAANEGLMARNISAIRASAVTMPMMMLALNGGLVAAVWLGGAQVKIGSLQAGQLIAFVNYLLQALMSLMMVSMLVLRLARSEASAARIAEVLDSQQKVPNAPPSGLAPTSASLRGRVAFSDVTFSYAADGQDPVLKGISFVAEAGQTVAILGATGSGKSSLVHLIPRFYDATAGRVTLDGTDVRDLDEAVLRQAIAIALQESVLFTGTIRDNIRYGRPEAGDEEVVAAAQVAQAHDFIHAFPEGYDTQVGQRGVNLSGGQKQRIAIARALLTQPAILILDDSTSAVDVGTEARIVAALDAMPNPPTRFIVAQRLSTVLTADMILILDDGRLVAQGTHAGLLATSPVYRDIYESQVHNGVVSHGPA